MTRVMQMSPGSTHSYSHWLFIDFQPTPNADIMILITTTFFLFRERPTDSLCLGRFLWRRRFDSSKAIAFSFILARCILTCINENSRFCSSDTYGSSLEKSPSWLPSWTENPYQQIASMTPARPFFLGANRTSLLILFFFSSECFCLDSFCCH